MLETLRQILDPRDIVTEASDLAPYLADGFGGFSGTALAAVTPRTTKDVAAIVKACSGRSIAMVPRGGGSGLAGAAAPLPNRDQIVISLEKMNTIREVDDDNNVIIAEAGCILSHIQHAADNANRMFPVSFGAEGTAQIGGIISTNAGGNNVVRYGMTRAQILGLEVVLPDGTIWNDLKRLRKDNTGYDLKQIFIGAEGTLGIITAAVLALSPKPQSRATALVAVPNIDAALALFRALREEIGELINAFELIPKAGIEAIKARTGSFNNPFAEPQDWMVLIEVKSAAKGINLAIILETALTDLWEQTALCDAVIAQSETQAKALWAIREHMSEALAGSRRVLKFDTSVPIAAIPQFMMRSEAAMKAISPHAYSIPFGHIGDGNIHFNIAVPDDFDLTEFTAQKPAFTSAIHQVAVDLDGAISAEHGLGQLKRDDAAKAMPAERLTLMRTLKSALDPQWIMNPGKVMLKQ